MLFHPNHLKALYTIIIIQGIQTDNICFAYVVFDSNIRRYSDLSVCVL